MERNDIVTLRNAFLRNMCTLCASGNMKSIIYLDKTWVSENHSKTNIWQNDMSSANWSPNNMSC